MDNGFGVGILFFVIGTIFLSAAIYFLKKYKKVQENGRKTKAKVLAYKEHKGEEYSCFIPIIEFNNEKGELTKANLTFGEGKPKYDIGSSISITYLKEGSEYEIIINNNSEIYLYYGFIALGLIFSLIGIGLLMKHI